MIALTVSKDRICPIFFPRFLIPVLEGMAMESPSSAVPKQVMQGEFWA